MNDVNKEYGAALFMLACEENKKEEYGKDLEFLKKTFREAPEYIEFLSSPGIPLGERLSAVEAAFSECISERVLSYLMLMCEKGRIDGFFDAMEEYNALLDASKHISTAKIISAVELTENEKTKLYDKLKAMSGGDVTMEYSVDNSLIGGLIVELDGKIMDGSLRNRLREVKDVINS